MSQDMKKPRGNGADSKGQLKGGLSNTVAQDGPAPKDTTGQGGTSWESD